jgi:hypothetical protein
VLLSMRQLLPEVGKICRQLTPYSPPCRYRRHRAARRAADPASERES